MGQFLLNCDADSQYWNVFIKVNFFPWNRQELLLHLQAAIQLCVFINKFRVDNTFWIKVLSCIFFFIYVLFLRQWYITIVIIISSSSSSSKNKNKYKNKIKKQQQQQQQGDNNCLWDPVFFIVLNLFSDYCNSYSLPACITIKLFTQSYVQIKETGFFF